MDSGSLRSLVGYLLCHDFGKGGIKNFQCLVDLLFADGQRAQALDDLAVVAAGFDHQAVGKGFLADGGGGVAIRAVDAQHHAATLEVEGVGAVLTDDLLHAVSDTLTLGLHALGELVVDPEVLQRSSSGNESVVVATEGTVVFARLPLVEFVAHDHDGKRQAKAAERLGQGDDVWLDAHLFKAEEGAGSTAAGLNVINNQQHVVLAAQFFQFAHPVGRCGIQAAFALNHLNNYCSRLVDTAARVAEHLVHHGDGVDLVTEVVGVGHAADVSQRYAGSAAVMAVTGGSQCTDGATVEAIGKADDIAAAGYLASQFQGCFNGVGAGRAAELDLVRAQATRLQDHAVEGLQEALFGVGVHVQAVGDAVIFQVLDQRLFQDRVVVPVVQGAGTGQKVDVALAFAGHQLGATGLLEDHRERAAVAANIRFVFLELFKGIHELSWSQC